MKLITIQFSNGNELHAHVESEQKNSDDSVDMVCVDEYGSMFKMTMWENEDETLKEQLTSTL